MTETPESGTAQRAAIGDGYFAAHTMLVILIMVFAYVTAVALSDRIVDAVVLDITVHPFEQVIRSTVPAWFAGFALLAVLGPAFVYFTAVRLPQCRGTGVQASSRTITQLVLAGCMTVTAWIAYEGVVLADDAKAIEVSQTLVVAASYDRWCEAKRFAAPADVIRSRGDDLDARAKDIELNGAGGVRAWSQNDRDACAPGVSISLKGHGPWVHTQAWLGAVNAAAFLLTIFCGCLLMIAMAPLRGQGHSKPALP